MKTPVPQPAEPRGCNIGGLYEKYVDTVYRLCLTLLRNHADAEDAVQNTFVKLIRHGKQFDSAEHEKAWLLVTAANTCKDMLRQSSRKTECIDEHSDSLTASESGSDDPDVLTAVFSLPIKYRSPVYLYYYEGYSGNEIAAMMKKPASTVRNYLHEARILLKNKLGGDFDEE